MHNQEEAANVLAALLKPLKLDLSESQYGALIAYLELLQQWNKAYNLTAIKDWDAMLRLHIADSLAIAPYVHGQHICDWGTGAGLPGIPLSICYPDKSFVLIDSVGKKVRFLRHVVAQLGLDNVTLIHDRIESYQTPTLFDVILARAVASLENIVNLSAHLCKPTGLFVLQKGNFPEAELAQLHRGYEVIKLQVPGIDAERHVIVIKNGERND